MHYRPLATGVGILAGYLAAALGLSYYVRRRIGPRLWRKLHRLTVVVYVMGVAHALTAGTDAATPWLRTVVLATAVPIGALFAVRVTGIGRRRAPQKRGEPRPAARRTADVAAPARG
jgi:sulfoxide reductase heme-binding subunit YedZ